MSIVAQTESKITKTPSPRSPSGYQPPTVADWVSLRLDGNEGPSPSPSVMRALQEIAPEELRQYPTRSKLEATIAVRFGIDANQVCVTAGADDAIDRVCRSFLGPNRSIVVPKPTFEMIERYAKSCGARIIPVNWSDRAYPVEAVINAVTDNTTVIAVISPNNPTGTVATRDDLIRLATTLPDRLIMLDHAYVEFADEDLTDLALTLPNVIVTRTFSKAWGLAGLRVGYALGSAANIDRVRAAAGPYPVSGLSIELAQAAWKNDEARTAEFVQATRTRREKLTNWVRATGGRTTKSQANFVFARFDDAAWIYRCLCSLGIAVRRFEDPQLVDALRLTCPINDADCAQLESAFTTIARPEAMLFDLDGVLADVSQSYRAAIMATVQTFGGAVTAETIARYKAAGNANNDWLLSQKILRDQGIEIDLPTVRETFERLYQGSDSSTGLCTRESLTVDRCWIERLAQRYPLALVTGRPRRDAMAFLQRFGIERSFKAMMCMEDATAKPDPEPVALALQQLGVENAWMIGDTPDDIVAARSAAVLPLGLTAPGDERRTASIALNDAGAARVLTNIEALEDLLP